ncbi:RNI-like protein, partial [Periconia macrospinosa]
AMEDIHGVDVSWLHHSTRDHHHRQHAPSTPGLPKDVPPPTSSHGGLPSNSPPLSAPDKEPRISSSAPAVQNPSLPSSPPSTPSPAQKIPTKRPALLNRTSGDKPGSVTPPGSRKGSWISSLSSKFSSQNPSAQPTPAQAQGSPVNANGTHGPTSSANGALNGIQAAANGNHGAHEPYVPQPPKSSFISNALRRLSSGAQVGTVGRTIPQGGVCPRKVMNIDSNRNRCLVPELDANKLRRVAFCVDVEIASGPKYKDDLDTEDKKKKRKDKKLKERGEGEALKHPESVANEKEKVGTITVNDSQEVVGTEEAPNPEGTVIEEGKKETTRKKEKKKRSEAERKERKEKKRRKAEENGSVPLELTRDEDDKSTDGTDTVNKTPPRHQDRPTTDPLRIYRRCCQLRETPILKRISDQLSSPSACALIAPGVVTCLDLTGSRLQLADVVTLSDWLAVVPVKKLLLEDADLTDEKIRLILAGLLGVRVPKTHVPNLETSKEGGSRHADRSGVVKKLLLKNNPKITAEGWGHIALFIYMCKSIVALDVSMVPFPVPTKSQHSTTNTPQASIKPSEDMPGNIAEIFSKAIAERLGGSRLEELSLSECGLSSPVLRKIIDGCIVSGVQRMGLAGNDLDDEGIDHIIHYLRSGVCQGLDLGGNALSDSIEKLADCFTSTSPLWALSLANADLTPDSLKKLFPALVRLPNFRFLELSHNKDLFSHSSSLCLLRKYMPQLTGLRRIHLNGVSLSPADVIGLAEMLPECKHIAHVDMLENPQITTLAQATDEETQEEAAAVFTSLTMAAKVSRTLICVNIDVPAPGSNEVVKALAKQVVAYCLRNMGNYHEDVPELKEGELMAEEKEVDVPDVLMHLVGHKIGAPPSTDNETPAPDDDYIVGGIGFAKALSYCLSQKATDLRRQSVPVSGTATPRSTRAEDLEDICKAKAMSKNLLEYARNIRARVQPALIRVARSGSDQSYRRLFMLDQTLQGIIQRFEDEYPETRLQPLTSDAASTHSSNPSTSPPASTVPTLSTTVIEGTPDSDEEDSSKLVRSRHNSDVNLASRAQALEEGRVHRVGHRLRTELFKPTRPSSSQSGQANLSGSMDNHDLPEHMVALRQYFYKYSGEELREMSKGAGWDSVFDQIAENAKELKALEHENPEEFARFRETQITALKNRNLSLGGEVSAAAGAGAANGGANGGNHLQHVKHSGDDDFAVED